MSVHSESSFRREAFRGLLLTDLSLRIAALDHGAASILGRHGSNGKGLSEYELPRELTAALQECPIGEAPEHCISFQMGHRMYMCRVTVLHPWKNPPDKPMFGLYMYRDTDVEEAIAQFASDYELTERERQTLIGVANGLTCKEIAETMNISPNTVKSFLRLLMIKIGVTRRGGIISKFLDHHRHQM